MKKLYFWIYSIILILSIQNLEAQNLIWSQPEATGTGNASVAIISGSVSLNSSTVTNSESLIGVFYENNSGNLTCAGYIELDADYMAGGAVNIAVWGADSGLDNGLDSGEEMAFYLNVDGVDYPHDNITWAQGNSSFEANGLYVISEINFTEGQDELEPCSCLDTDLSEAQQVLTYCIITNGCSDSSSDNYCFGGDYSIIYQPEENCIYGEVEGCTCPLAVNYNSEAGIDDGTCYMMEGCSDALADNYSLSGCDAVAIVTEICTYSGCTCPIAVNFDPIATINDGSCVATSSEICIDPLASNFSEGCENTQLFGGDNCEYGGCELENISWDFSITDANMTVQVGSDVVTLNGEAPPTGSLIGAFFTNNNNELSCAGYEEWTGQQLAISLWASESGLDNGFATNEEITWLLFVGNQTFTANSTMNSTPPFTTNFAANGFGQLLSIDFECEVIGVFGCTDENAVNYNSDATIDDGSCYTLDWSFEVTDCNMTVVANESEIQSFAISLNGEAIPTGAIIGGFYTNANGQFACGGSSEWTGTTTSIAIMGAESGVDNGFQNNEAINTWFLLIGDQVIPMDNNGASMNNIGFSDTYSCNGFGQILSVNFEGEYTLTYGCTDSDACNYDESAIIDDNTCTFANNWFSDDDGDGLGDPDVSTTSCNDITGFVTNSDDPCPESFDNINIWYWDTDGDGLGDPDGFTVEGCADPSGDFGQFANNNNDPCPGTALNDSDQDGICDDIDDCIGELDAIGICNGDCELDTDGDGICDTDEIPGCQDESACNYDDLATDDDGQCYNNDLGCGCDTPAANSGYDCDDNCLNDSDGDGVCDEFEITGCTDSSACNYDALATDNDGQCYNNDLGCGCDTPAANSGYDCNGNCLTDSDDDGVCDEFEITGCTDSSACNYDAFATDDDGQCYNNDLGCGCDTPAANSGYDCDDNCLNDSDGDGVCDEFEITGCTDSSACNYDALATNDNGLCYNNDLGCGCDTPAADAGYDCNGNCLTDSDGDGVCDEFEIIGCQDESACNFNPNATELCVDTQEIENFSLMGSFNTSQYYISNTQIQLYNNIYDDYSSIANDYGGYILTIGSSEEQDAIYEIFMNNYYQGGYPLYWIGLYNTDVNQNDGAFEWLNGESLEYTNWGGTDPNGDEYFTTAYFNDGSWGDVSGFETAFMIIEVPLCCTYAPEGESCAGCTDNTACNYNPSSTTDDGSCIFPDGCTESSACNYNIEAICDDGSCILPTTWYLDNDGDGLGFDGFGLFSIESCDDNINGYATNNNDNNDGDFDNDGISGINFNGDDCDDSNNLIGSPNEGYDCNEDCINDFDGDLICDEFEINGCTDSFACNYDSTATDNDNSCIYAIDFYDCNFVCLSDVDDDGVCDELEVNGCTDITACNYNPQATEADDSCTYLDGICQTCVNLIIVDNDIDNDGICNNDEIPGCTDNTACNYNISATDNDQSCNYVDGICQTCVNLIIVDNDIDNDGVCDNDEIPGCTDNTACNYDDSATDNDQSCNYVDGICQTCVDFIIVDNDIDNDGVCDNDEIPGCTDNTACNYDSFATDDDQSCTYLYGVCDTCEDSIVVTNDIDNDGVCDSDEVPGCTDTAACNFDPELGCTDDDGSCYYSEITVEISTTIASCEATCDGEINLIIDNGQPPYTVSYTYISDNNNTIFITGGDLLNACSGSYGITVTDFLGCSETLFTSVEAIIPDSDGDGICDTDELLGCTDSSACNFNILNTDDDGSCEYCYSELGDIDGNGIDDCQIINDNAELLGNPNIYGCDGCINDMDFDGVCDELEVIGCIEEDACNYTGNPLNNSCEDNNGDGIGDCCTYPSEFYLDCDELCINDIDNDGVCDEIEILGCQDEIGCNYNSNATDDGDCVFPLEFYDCFGCINDIDEDGICDELEIIGCQDGLACNFNPDATDNEGEEGLCFYLDLSTYVDPNIQNVTCSGDANGAFILYASGGNGPYTLFIQDFIELETNDGIFNVNGCSGGSYDVVITDVNGCETLETVNIEEPSLIDISIDYLDFISCNGNSDASLTNSIQGGNPPYTYQWVDVNGNTISFEQDIFNLTAGAYALEVVDAIGCSNQASFIVGNPNSLEVDQSIINNVSCYDGSDGSIELFIIGGASPFTYTFTSQSGSDVNPNNLSAGTYQYFVTDDNGCAISDSFIITQPSSTPSVSISASDFEICEYEEVSINATPGFQSYTWMEVNGGTLFGDNDNELIVNESGEYYVTATNNDGCEAYSETIEIIVYDNPTIVIGGNGNVSNSASYSYYISLPDNESTYQWSIEDSEMGTITGSSNNDSIEINWLVEGNTTLNVTELDANGCSSSSSLDISVTWSIGLDDVEKKVDFNIYPNPLIDYTTINIMNLNNETYNLYLYDLKGTLIKSYINNINKQIKLENEFSSGLYYLELTNNNQNKRKILIVQ